MYSEVEMKANVVFFLNQFKCQTMTVSLIYDLINTIDNSNSINPQTSSKIHNATVMVPLSVQPVIHSHNLASAIRKKVIFKNKFH